MKKPFKGSKVNMSEKLYSDRPANRFEEAFPLGCGRLGAMIYGGIKKDKISLNLDELWTGFPRDENKKGAFAFFEEARRLTLERKNSEAERIIEEKVAGYNVQSYQPAGSIIIERPESVFSSYSRYLYLDRAGAEVSFTQNCTAFRVYSFTSAPRECLIVRYTASRAGAISLKIGYDCPLRHTTGAKDGIFFADGECMFDSAQNRNEFPERNKYYSDRDDERGILFRVAMLPLVTGGSASVCDQGITIESADEVILIVSAESSFAGYKRHPFLDGKEYKNAVGNRVKEAERVSFEKLLAEHEADYKNLYDRVSLTLEEGEDRDALATAERLIRHAEDRSDVGLHKLLFDYGRYLLISSSRPGSQAANLQGIWNEQVDPPWNADYTVNINTEMNYWGTLTCDLRECQEPLDALISEVCERGKETAEEYYGARGFCLHHNTDIWRACQPVHGRAVWLFWSAAGGWLCRHLFEEYEYSGDTGFLVDTAYPVMLRAARFCLDLLTEDSDGYLIFCPSTSPENRFCLEDGAVCSVSATSTMTMSVIRELFENVIKAAKIIEDDSPDIRNIKKALLRLLPVRTGKDGRILEWYEEYPEAEPHHRHLSHLYGLYPGRLITPEKTPELAKAAKLSLDARGDGGTGWSLGWKINLRARLFDGDRALKLIDMQLTPADISRGGGTYPNMFDAHPPFQIDGNFGASAGIAEMLMQSDGDRILLLPALPEKWKSGEIRGLRAKGGAKVDITWKDGRITDYKINGGKPCEIIKCR